MTTLSEPQLISALALRYAAPAWAFLPQVRNQTGYGNAVRTADAIAMSVWPSRGLAIHGFEVKVSRSDFLREMKDPQKAEALAKFCDHWWLVLGDAGIATLAEVPKSWGVLVPHGKSVKCAREAPPLPNQPLTRDFLASMLRNACEGLIPKSALHEMVEAQVAEKLESHIQTRVRTGNYEAQQVQQELDSLRSTVTQFETASGVKIASYYNGNPQDIGRAVKFVLGGGMETAARALPDIAAQLRRSLAFVEAQIAGPGHCPRHSPQAQAACTCATHPRPEHCPEHPE